MKKILTIFLITSLAITSIFANGDSEKQSATSSDSAEKIVFKVGVNNPATHPMGQAWAKFGEILNQKSDGRLQLDIYYGGQLGSKATCLQGLQTGVIDMYMITPNVLADYGAEKLKVLSFPYIFKSIEHARAFEQTSAADDLLNYIQESGTRMVGLGWYQDLPRNYFFSKDIVSNLSQMKGLKIRAQSSSIDLETIKSLGANPVTVAFSELYSALQTGIVDGAEQPYTGFYSNQFQEVTKSMILDNHQIIPSIGLISEITWNKLSDSDKQLVKECFKESSDYWDGLIDTAAVELKQAIQDAGVKVIEPTDKAEWRDAVQPVYDKYGEEYASIINSISSVQY